MSKKIAIQAANVTSKLLPDEIDGASTFVYKLKSGERTASVSSSWTVKIFVLCSGHANIGGISCDGRGIFAFQSDTEITVEAISDITLLEIEFKAEKPKSDALPYFTSYGDAPRYKEDCKSEKTVNRMLMPEGLIPGIAIGSVETYGKDRIEKHTHPFCDQLFFSFEENDMEVMIDDDSVHMGGNMILHIPIGSSHGVSVSDGGCAHYLWIDFVIDERGAEYISSAHKMI